MSGYREGTEILKSRHVEIEGAARALMGNFSLDADKDQNESAWFQARMLTAAFALYLERDEVTPDAWKSAGYLGNLLALKGKVNRLMASLWYKVAPNGNAEKPIDNALDAINYAAFFARLYEAGDERGKPWD